VRNPDLFRGSLDVIACCVYAENFELDAAQAAVSDPDPTSFSSFLA
jgi:hypothetical protein